MAAQNSGSMDAYPDDGGFKNADIFLNIAKDSNRRRSSFGFPRRSINRNSNTSNSFHQSSSPDPSRFETSSTYSPSDSPSTTYNAPPLSTSASISAHPLDDLRHHNPHSRYQPHTSSRSSSTAGGIPRSRLTASTSPDTSPESIIERRRSVQGPRPYRHTNLSTIRSSRQPSGSDTTERPAYESPDQRMMRLDGAGSTVSTDATSTVWNELDDLKSRIRKLELTGKLPSSSSSQAAMPNGSAERPRTAAGMSASPKARKGSVPSTGDSEMSGQTHPLLHAAFDKAKGVLSNEVSSAMGVTISDAVSLSAILGGGGGVAAPSGAASVISGYGTSTEKHARRKADSLCRSLTELCLALSEEPVPRQRAISRDSNTRATIAQPNGPPRIDRRPSTAASRTTYRRSLNQHELESLTRQPPQQHVSSIPSRSRSLATNSSPLVDWDDRMVSAPRSRRLSTMSVRPRRFQIAVEGNEREGGGSIFKRSLSRSGTIGIGNTGEFSTPMPLRRVTSREDIRDSPPIEISQKRNHHQQQQQQQETPQSQPTIPTTPLRRSPYNYTPPIPNFRNYHYGLRSSLSPSVEGDGQQQQQEFPHQTNTNTNTNINNDNEEYDDNIISPSTKSKTGLSNRKRTDSFGMDMGINMRMKRLDPKPPPIPSLQQQYHHQEQSVIYTDGKMSEGSVD